MVEAAKVGCPITGTSGSDDVVGVQKHEADFSPGVVDKNQIAVSG